MPSWIGPWEIAIVLVLILLIFGPRKLPDLGASLGKSIRGFRKGLKETQDEVSSAVAEARTAGDTDAEPMKAVAAASVQATATQQVTAAAPVLAEAVPLATAAEAVPAAESPAAESQGGTPDQGDKAE